MNRFMKTMIIMYIKMDQFLSHATVNINKTVLSRLLHMIILYYNCFLSSPEHLKEMDFPLYLRSSELVPTVCGINILPAPVYCKALYMLIKLARKLDICLFKLQLYTRSRNMATWKIILALDFTLEQVETINILLY